MGHHARVATGEHHHSREQNNSSASKRVEGIVRSPPAGRLNYASTVRLAPQNISKTYMAGSTRALRTTPTPPRPVGHHAILRAVEDRQQLFILLVFLTTQNGSQKLVKQLEKTLIDDIARDGRAASQEVVRKKTSTDGMKMERSSRTNIARRLSRRASRTSTSTRTTAATTSATSGRTQRGC